MNFDPLVVFTIIGFVVFTLWFLRRCKRDNWKEYEKCMRKREEELNLTKRGNDG